MKWVNDLGVTIESSLTLLLKMNKIIVTKVTILLAGAEELAEAKQQILRKLYQYSWKFAWPLTYNKKLPKIFLENVTKTLILLKMRKCYWKFTL